MAERNGASASSEGASSAPDAPKPVPPQGRYKEMSSFGMAISLAFEFAAAVFLFWFLGRLVDNWLGIEPWAQVTGGVIGWIGGILHVYISVERKGLGDSEPKKAGLLAEARKHREKRS